MLMLMIIITSVTLVMTKVMVTKSDDDFFNLLECPIPLSSVLCPPLRHKKSGSLLFLLYFSNLVKWISPKLQTVFLTT